MKIFTLSVLICALLFQRKCVESARILGAFAVGGKSLNMLYNRLMKDLADAGHDVTVISPYKNKLPILNGSYTDILLTGFSEKYHEMLDEMKLLESPEQNPITTTATFLDETGYMGEDAFLHPNVKKLLASDAKFDLFITENLWSETLFMFAHIYNCPIVDFTSTGGVNPWAYDMVGAPIPPSYAPHFFYNGDFSSGMTFSQRMHNLLFYVHDFYYYHFNCFPRANKFLKTHFKNAPDFATLYTNVSLLLVGSHSSLRKPIPSVPNVVEIGGFHIDPPKKLPKDLQDYLDSAKDGAIYFSMGTHVKSSDFSTEKMQIVLNVFRRLKLKVLWKYEDENLPGIPQNLLIKKWVPQMDILAHPNIKLFISHGGYCSILETIYHGVPALLIPVFFDQFHNSNEAQELGFALKLSYNDKNFNEETLVAMIEEMLKNPKYTENAKLRSKLFHDRPAKPLDTAIYWIEYVIRHKGADHLKVARRNLYWYQYYMIDVLLFLVLSITLGLYAVYVCSKYLYKTFRTSRKEKVKKS